MLLEEVFMSSMESEVYLYRGEKSLRHSLGVFMGFFSQVRRFTSCIKLSARILPTDRQIVSYKLQRSLARGLLGITTELPRIFSAGKQ